MTIEDYIIRNAKDKGGSIYDDNVTFSRRLLVDNSWRTEDLTPATVSAKATASHTVVVNMDHVTLIGDEVGIEGRNKYGGRLRSSYTT